MKPCHSTLVWITVFVEPYHPNRIALLFWKPYLVHAVGMEQLPYLVYYVLSQFLDPPAKINGCRRLVSVSLSHGKQLHVRMNPEIPVHIFIIEDRVDITAQNQPALLRHHLYCFLLVFSHDRVSALEGIPYSYIILCHNSYDLIVCN